MSTKIEEKRAYKKLCDAVIRGGDLRHRVRVLQVEYANYKGNAYGAYIGGFGETKKWWGLVLW